nr:2848_t:CDS:2 [Entrophospora candida]
MARQTTFFNSTIWKTIKSIFTGERTYRCILKGYEAEDMFRGTRYHEEISKNNSNHQSLESHATIVQLEMTVEWFQENIKDVKGHEQLRINFVQIKNIAYKKKFLPCDS